MNTIATTPANPAMTRNGEGGSKLSGAGVSLNRALGADNLPSGNAMGKR